MDFLGPGDSCFSGERSSFGSGRGKECGASAHVSATICSLTRCFMNEALFSPPRRALVWAYNGKIMQSERRCISALNFTVWIHWDYSQWIKFYAFNISHFWQPRLLPRASSEHYQEIRSGTHCLHPLKSSGKSPGGGGGGVS